MKKLPHHFFFVLSIGLFSVSLPITGNNINNPPPPVPTCEDLKNTAVLEPNTGTVVLNSGTDNVCPGSTINLVISTTDAKWQIPDREDCAPLIYPVQSNQMQEVFTFDNGWTRQSFQGDFYYSYGSPNGDVHSGPHRYRIVLRKKNKGCTNVDPFDQTKGSSGSGGVIITGGSGILEPWKPKCVSPTCVTEPPVIIVIPEDLDPDRDGIPTTYEDLYDTMDSNVSDSHFDVDLDGLSNLEEYELGTNPEDPDTDDDGMTDGWEFYYGFSLFDGLSPAQDADTDDNPGEDPDGDGLLNVDEFAFEGNPDVLNSDARPVVNKAALVPLTVGDPSFPVPIPGGGQLIWDAELDFPYLDPSTADSSLPLGALPYRAPAGAYDYDGNGVINADDVPPEVRDFDEYGLPDADASVNPGFYYFDEKTAQPYINVLFPITYTDLEDFDESTGTFALKPYQIEGLTVLQSRKLTETVTLSFDHKIVIANQLETTLVGTIFPGQPKQIKRLTYVPGIGTLVPDPESVKVMLDDGGMSDEWEARKGLAPFKISDSNRRALPRLPLKNWQYYGMYSSLNVDTDNDLLPDVLENTNNSSLSYTALGTLVTSADSDGDTIPDGLEVFYDLDPLEVNLPGDDKDLDGIDDRDEIIIDGLIPNLADTDWDGIPDGWEKMYATDTSGQISGEIQPNSFMEDLKMFYTFDRFRDGILLDDTPLDATAPRDGVVRGLFRQVDGYMATGQEKMLFLDPGTDIYGPHFIQFEDNPDLDLGTDHFSLAFWFVNYAKETSAYPNFSNIYSAERLIFQKEGAYECVVLPATNEAVFRVYRSAGAPVELRFSGINPIATGGKPQAYHFTFTYDVASGSLSGYLNGNLVASVAITAADIQLNNHPLILGSKGSVPSKIIEMGLDDWRIYDRVLTALEIEMLSDPWHPQRDENRDRDGDGLTEFDEYRLEYSPFVQQVDSDGDSIPDALELNGFYVNAQQEIHSYDDQNPPVPPAGEEYFLYFTDPKYPDMDGDGLTDYEEAVGTPATITWTDSQGASFSITGRFATSPDIYDTDRDGLNDKLEFQLGTHPLLRDTDGDGIGMVLNTKTALIPSQAMMRPLIWMGMV